VSAVGVGGGVVASLVMALFAMVASATYQHTGFFTPLHHIASSIISGSAMMRSMQAAMGGNSFLFAPTAAVVGAVLHLMTGAAFGVVFVLVARALRLRGATVVAVGAIFGLAVFAASTWIGLPIVASLFGGGDPVRNMATMVGYPTFVIEHVIFGLALGALVTRPLSQVGPTHTSR